MLLGGTLASSSVVCVLVAQSCPTPCEPVDCSPPGSSVHRILQARILEWVAFPFSKGSSQPRDQTQVSTLQADSLPAGPPGKPKNTGVGSQSLLQGNLPTQELNQGLLHGRRILYQWSYQGSPVLFETWNKKSVLYRAVLRAACCDAWWFRDVE